jgi:hypothetical protein
MIFDLFHILKLLLLFDCFDFQFVLFESPTVKVSNLFGKILDLVQQSKVSYEV